MRKNNIAEKNLKGYPEGRYSSLENTKNPIFGIETFEVFSFRKNGHDPKKLKERPSDFAESEVSNLDKMKCRM